MKILIATEGGGGLVLLIVVVLLAGGHGGAVSGALVAVLIAAALIVVLGVAALAALLVHRVRRPAPGNVVQIPGPARPAWSSLDPADAPRALEPSREVRLEPGQLAELAEILRRSQRPE